MLNIFRNLLPALNPYLTDSNLERAREIQQAPSRPVPRDARPAGLSVIVLNLNRPNYIVPLVRQLLGEAAAFAAAGRAFEVIVGDTGSTDPEVLRLYAETPGLRVVRGLKYHFSKNNNAIAFEHATADTFLFLNNDTILPDGGRALWRMYTHLHARADTGVVGAVLLYPDKTVQHRGIEFFREGEARGLCFHPGAKAERLPAATYPAAVPAVTGACLMARAADVFQAGGMDEGYHKECQDVALCLAIHRLGKASAIVDTGDFYHLENGTRAKGEEEWADRRRFLRKWALYVEAMV